MKKFILILSILIFLCSFAFAEDVWVLCQPNSYVNVRPFPSKKQEPCGVMECGWKASTNGKMKKGYIYLDSVSNEEGCGWVHRGYVVYSEPVIITITTNIYGKGRVACWRSIKGTRRCWSRPGDLVTVYAVSEEWCVTNKGFIKTEFLGLDYNRLYKQYKEEKDV